MTLAWWLLLPMVAAAQEAERPAPREAPLPPKPAPPGEEEGEGDAPIAFRYSTDEAIAFFEARVRRDAADFSSLRYLGELYERKAGESTDHAAWYAKAETALREAVRLQPDFPRAEASLAFVLCARHQFAEALKIARSLLERVPGDPDALATSGDALLELGRYEEAAATYEALQEAAQSAPIWARLANLDEFNGRLDEAVAWMTRALERARSGGEKGGAWYASRLGDLQFAAGRLDEADSLYRSVPADVDTHHDVTFSLARLRLAQGRPDEALKLAEEAVGIGPDPHMLVFLGDLYLARGEGAKAEDVFKRFLDATGDDAETRRERALFLADHARDLDEAVTLARKDHDERPGIYAEDALAWCLHRAGREPERSRELAERALRLGTRDPRLHYHAGVILAARGDREKAAGHLRTALGLNAHFHPTQADEARRLLAELAPRP